MGLFSNPFKDGSIQFTDNGTIIDGTFYPKGSLNDSSNNLGKANTVTKIIGEVGKAIAPGTIDNASLGDSLDNLLTGDLDFNRQFYLQEYNNAYNAVQAQLTRDFNESENEKQRNWYEEMSNTAYQRQVKDLQNAGLNPYLSLNTGAPVAYGSSASSTSPTATGVANSHYSNNLSNIITTAMKNTNITNNILINSFTKLISNMLK